MKTIPFPQTGIVEHTEQQALGRAVGEDRGYLRSSQIRPYTAQEDKVIDLAAWKTENLVELEELGGLESGLELYEGRELVRRPRRKHNRALIRGELAATLSVTGVMVAMILRVLVF